MKAKEIRNMDKSSLKEKLLDLRKELVKMNAQIAIGTTIKNSGQVKELKKTLAKIVTIEQEKAKHAKKKNQEVGKKA